MRRFDKKHNIEKANLLAEQRYLESKGTKLNEEAINEMVGDDKYDLKDESNLYELMREISKYVSSSRDFPMANDNMVILYNLFKSGDIFNHVDLKTPHQVGYGASEDPMIRAGKGIYANDKEAMAQFLSDIGKNPDEYKIVSREDLKK